MNGYREAARYLAALLQERLRAAREGDSQAGALSLEWIIIAVVLAAAAAAAVLIFYNIVINDAHKLPSTTPEG